MSEEILIIFRSQCVGHIPLYAYYTTSVRENSTQWGAFPKSRHSHLREEEEVEEGKEDTKKENVTLWNLKLTESKKWKFSLCVE